MRVGGLLSVFLVASGVHAGCKGYNCTFDGTSRCDGNAVVTCTRPGNRDLRTSNYLDESHCGPGLVCVEKNLQAGCALDAVPCDTTKFEPTITEYAGGVEIIDCDVRIGGDLYRAKSLWTTCDPATFKPTCPSYEIGTMCVTNSAIEARYPPLRGLHYVRRKFCRGCDPSSADLGCRE